MYRKVKRILDAALSFILIVTLSPVFFVASFLIMITMGRPVLYTQERIGLNNSLFTAYKFRSMRDKTDQHQTDAQRITKTGRLLRVSRVDEFPQLFNILIGDMSFIGPRPLLPEYMPFYSKQELKRHDVRPGLSGLSQVSASYPSWEKQFRYDLEYIEKMSFLFDLKIFLSTFIRVLMPSKKLISGSQGRIRLDIQRKAAK